ncbi:MAG: rRNA maturation RNase YbeY [Syntrophorhabdales bacterium]|nr:rRNA maturation RNase YbeY [Syntrophorhabdales bacterium]
MKIDKRQIKSLIEVLLTYSGLQGRHVSLLFTDNKKIRELNRQFFGRDLPTNVISFSYMTAEDMGVAKNIGVSIDEEVIGDIIISLEKAVEEAEEVGCDLHERLMALIIHGLLHIKGFEHERGGNEARRMRYQEKKLLRYIMGHERYRRLILKDSLKHGH